MTRTATTRLSPLTASLLANLSQTTSPGLLWGVQNDTLLPGSITSAQYTYNMVQKYPGLQGFQWTSTSQLPQQGPCRSGTPAQVAAAIQAAYSAGSVITLFWPSEDYAAPDSRSPIRRHPPRWRKC